MQMVSNPSNIAVNLDECLKHDCAESCDKPECELCLSCLSDQQLGELHEAYREHTKRGGFKRVFPSKSHPTAEDLTEKSQFVAKWLAAKCKSDENWC
jgi:tubulin monoglycylase TTLL15